MTGSLRDAYEAMVAESVRTSMPVAFENDLTVHDFNRLRGEDAPEEFGWVLRECGTLLLDARMTDASRRGYLGHITESGRCDRDRCYFWDGQKLHEVTAEEMAERMSPHAEGRAPQQTKYSRY